MSGHWFVQCLPWHVPRSRDPHGCARCGRPASDAVHGGFAIKIAARRWVSESRPWGHA